MANVEQKKSKMKKARRTQRTQGVTTDMMGRDAAGQQDSAANYAERLPREAGSEPSQLEYVRDIYETPHALFEPHGVLGQRHFDRSVYDATKRWQEAELNLIRKNFLETQVWDLADPYQKQMAMKAAPSIINSRMSQVQAAAEQFEWISKMTLQTAFQSEAEVNRMINILGGAEPLISLNHYFGALVEGDDRRAIQELFAPTADMGLYSVGDLRNRWMQAAINEGAVKNVLINLAAQVLHLFPVQYGKLRYDPAGEDVGRVNRPFSSVGIEVENRVAAELQSQCVRACAVMSYGSFMQRMQASAYGGEEIRPAGGGPAQAARGDFAERPTVVPVLHARF